MNEYYQIEGLAERDLISLTTAIVSRRQLGRKSAKHLSGITVTDNMKQFGKGLGSSSPEVGYFWYVGI